jgi:hypothetical protein
MKRRETRFHTSRLGFRPPQVGAQVALQQCPILRLGQPNATLSNISFPVTHHRPMRKETDRIGQRTSSSPIRRILDLTYAQTSVHARL